MLKKKQVLAVVGIACVIAASLTVLVYAATWTPDQLADWMFNRGRHKIWQTNWILYNDIDPKVDAMAEKMGEGLVGQFKEGDVKTNLGGLATMWEYKPGGKPKKVSLYVDLSHMALGNAISIYVEYSIKGVALRLDDQFAFDGNVTKTLNSVFYGQQVLPGKLILDQLPVATHTKVVVYHAYGTSFTIPYQVIIEEL